MNSFERFSKLHQQSDPLLIANVWNAQSAKACESLGFQALATSSAAVAETLGYADGEGMNFEEYLMIIRRIRASTSLPCSVDLEAGYGKTAEEIVSNIRQLHELGIGGVNIEDSIVVESKRHIIEKDVFTKKIAAVCESLKSDRIDMFINLRCDAFLLSLPDACAEATARLEAYQQTGIHGLFFPCIFQVEDIRAIVSATQLPVNVMCFPGLPEFNQLQSLGVKRISMGNFMNKAVYATLTGIGEKVLSEQNCSSFF